MPMRNHDDAHVHLRARNDAHVHMCAGDDESMCTTLAAKPLQHIQPTRGTTLGTLHVWRFVLHIIKKVFETTQKPHENDVLEV